MVIQSIEQLQLIQLSLIRMQAHIYDACSLKDKDQLIRADMESDQIENILTGLDFYFERYHTKSK